jgi:aryl-alcohol dehydrogenase-like predicted oxidoreductase
MKRRSFLKGVGTASTALPVAGCSMLPEGKSEVITSSGKVPRRTLGKSGIEVSMLGFGSHLKQALVRKPKLRDRMIKRGFEGGINVFDVYDHSNYNQFEPMGNSLRGFRKDAVISLVAVKSTEEMQEEIDGALKVFHTDYIDLYRNYIIDDDRMNILEKNKQAGKIRAVGVVSHEEEMMMNYIDRYQNILDYVMIIYNFHHNNGFSNPDYIANDYSALIPRCKRMDLGILGIKPMGSDAMVALALKENYFEDKKANVAQAMLKHIFQNPEIDSAMPAMNSMEELMTNLEAAYSPALSAYEQKLLDNLSAQAASTKSAYLPDHYKWLESWSTKMA